MHYYREDAVRICSWDVGCLENVGECIEWMNRLQIVNLRENLENHHTLRCSSQCLPRHISSRETRKQLQSGIYGINVKQSSKRQRALIYFILRLF